MADLEIISNSVAQIDRTPDGLHYAFVKLDSPEKNVNSVDCLFEFQHLRYIDVSSNSISSLGRGLTSQKYLITLNASKNRISKIDEAVFSAKPYLCHLDLASNELTSLDCKVWPNLANLNLSQNQFAVFEIEQAPELSNIELRGNKLTTIALAGTPKLAKLYLATNQISVLSFLNGCAALELVHARDNLVASLDGLGSSLTRLSYLNLRNNKIESFYEVDHLKALTALSKLVLQGNPIAEQENYRQNVIYRVPQVGTLDKEKISPEEREEGEQVRVENERLKEEQIKAAQAQAEAEAATAADGAKQEAHEDGNAPQE